MTIPMTAPQRAAFEVLAVDAGLEFRKAYSGRHMYGSTCIAVVGDEEAFWRFALTLSDDRFDSIDLVELFWEEPPIRDNMARDYVWYWPHIEAGE